MREKRVTIKDISKRLNVSTTTVTKALNGMPRISDSMREEVQRIAKEMNYKPNNSAKALSRNELTIGVVYPVEPKEFYLHIENGLKKEFNNLLDFKVNALFYPVDGLNAVVKMNEALGELCERNIDGLIFSPGFNSSEYCPCLDKFIQQKKQVVYLVNEVENMPGIGCVRMDGLVAGRMAAQFLGFCLNSNSNVVVFSCNKEILVQKDCINGFIQEAKNQNLTIKGIYETQDDKKIAYYLMEKILFEMPEVNGVYVSSYNTAAVCKCLQDHHKEREIKVIGQDVFDEMIPYMRDGTLHATLFQDPYEQGKRAVRILYKRLIGEPVVSSYFIISPQLVMSSNLAAYIDF